MKNFARKVKHVLVSPSNFFEKVKKEKGLKHPIRYLVVFLLITQLFMVFYYFKHTFAKFGFNVNLSLATYILVYILTTIFTLFISFIRPALTNFFIRMFSDDNKFEDTYKAMIYGLTPDYLATPFFVITMIFLSATILLKNNLLLVVFIIAAIITLIAAIYSLYLRIYGVAKLHKISMLKSFLCIYIFPLLLIIVIEIIILSLFFVYLKIKA